MQFTPKYQTTNKLISNIADINRLIGELNGRHFPQLILIKLEKNARTLSSHTSTKIEGNPLPLTEVKKILKNNPQNIKDSQREVINYKRALIELNKKDNSKIAFNENLILKIQKTVTKRLLPKYQTGNYRTEPVVVNNPSTGQIVYLPPDAKDVKRLMRELFSFVETNVGKIDPLILAGIFHKQFVIIHPFVDGNGRTCRLATKVLLARLGVNTYNLFSFENYYNQNVTKYFDKVGLLGNYYDEVSAVDFTNWLEYFTDGVIREIVRVKGELEKMKPSPEWDLSKDQKKLVGVLMDKGYVNDSEYSRVTKRAKATRVQDFNKLMRLGLLERKGKGRATYYIEG